MSTDREVEVLRFIYDRLIYRYKEPINVDYMNALKDIIDGYDREKAVHKG